MFQMRRFKPGDMIIRTKSKEFDNSIGDDFSAKIGEVAIIKELSKNYSISYNVKLLDEKDGFGYMRVWDDQNCRLATKLEKALK